MKTPPPVYPGDIQTLDDYRALRTGTPLLDARGTPITVQPGIPTAWFPLTRPQPSNTRRQPCP